MKATINGITVEGTPQEIMEYQRMQTYEAQRKPFRIVTEPYNPKLRDSTDAAWVQLNPKVSGANTISEPQLQDGQWHN